MQRRGTTRIPPQTQRPYQSACRLLRVFGLRLLHSGFEPQKASLCPPKYDDDDDYNNNKGLCASALVLSMFKQFSLTATGNR